MKFIRLGGVLAGAMLLAPLATSTAQAAEITPASVAPSAYVQSDDCYYSHWWDGSWHRHVRLVCDNDDNNYYGGGGNFHRGGHFNRGGDHGNRGNFSGGNRGGNFRGNSGGNSGGHGRGR
jgi:hypothetical protein